MMKKTLLVLLVVFVILSTLSIPAYAKRPIDVSGTLDYTFEILNMREANGNTFLYATEHEDWAGDFTGEGDSVFRVGMFSSGFWNVWLRCEFTGTVLGDKEGTLVIQMVGKKPSDGDWYGQWVILSGAGDLANAHGQGTWWGPGFGDYSPMIRYSGQVHFGPK
jgi:hypothetical protein